MQNATQSPEQLFGNDVVDSQGNKIGSVDNVWVDDATNELEFVGVKTGWLMGKSHVIPMSDAQISGDTIQIPYSQDMVKDAPSFSGDAELSPDQESQVYSHYGVERSTAPSPTGLPAGEGSANSQNETSRFNETITGGDYSTVRDPSSGSDSQNVNLAEEKLQVGKRQVDAGQIRLRKVVREERQEVPVDLRREEVQIERVPAAGENVGEGAFQDQEITIPLSREEPVVGKEAHVSGQVRVNKSIETETRTVGDTIRREDVDVDRNAEATDQTSDYRNANNSEYNR